MPLRRETAHIVADTQAFYLDDGRTKIAQQLGAIRSRNILREVDYGKPVQRQRHLFGSSGINRGSIIAAACSNLSVEASLRHGQSGNIGTGPIDGALLGRIIAVVGGDNIEILLIFAAKREAGNHLGWNLHPPVECAVWFEAHN